MFATLRAFGVGALLAAFLFVGFGVQDVNAQAKDEISSAMKLQITQLIAAAVKTGNSEALEDGLTDLAESNQDLALAIASFAGKSLPKGLSSEVAGQLVASITTSVMTGAPVLASTITSEMSNAFPQHSALITKESQNTLSALAVGGFETAAGGNDTQGGGFLPNLPSGGANSTAENPSTTSASPAG